MVDLGTRGLRLDKNLVSMKFEFAPSIGINARQVEKFGMDIRSFRVPLERSIKQVMIPSIKRNFDEEGRPSWAPLAEKTVESRGEAGPILNRSGKLKKAMQAMARWTFTQTSASIQSLPADVAYGGVHQAGAAGTAIGVLVGKEIQAGTMGGVPQRRFVMFQDEDARDIDKVFADWLDERALAAGLNMRGG